MDVTDEEGKECDALKCARLKEAAEYTAWRVCACQCAACRMGIVNCGRATHRRVVRRAKHVSRPRSPRAYHVMVPGLGLGYSAGVEVDECGGMSTTSEPVLRVQ